MHNQGIGEIQDMTELVKNIIESNNLAKLANALELAVEALQRIYEDGYEAHTQLALQKIQAIADGNND